MTRHQKAETSIAASIPILTYTYHKPSFKPAKAYTMLMDLSTLNAALDKMCNESIKRSEKEVSYIKKRKQVKASGYSNSEKHY